MVDLETSAVTEEQLNAIMNLFFEDKSGDPIELFKKIFLLGKRENRKKIKKRNVILKVIK